MRLRKAVETDLDAMVELMYAEPGAEQVAFMPSLAGARVFMRETWRFAGVDEFVVAEDSSGVVGFAWTSDRGVSLRDGARAAMRAWGLTGPLRLAAKGWPRQLVELPMPEGPKLVELQTHPVRRGSGVGTLLLRHVIDEFGARPLSLTTRSDNPARHLYERHGFNVVAERRNGYFERRTGSPGRVLMQRMPTDA